MIDLVFINQILLSICIAIYAPMLPVIWLLIWLEYKHPATYKRLPKWLR
ncbi:hypothetical protein hairong_116 [Pseudomonas phage hairong]|nr:hypothetical protein hairong_116 [Pseudomonas phage hairong]